MACVDLLGSMSLEDPRPWWVTVPAWKVSPRSFSGWGVMNGTWAEATPNSQIVGKCDDETAHLRIDYNDPESLRLKGLMIIFIMTICYISSHGSIQINYRVKRVCCGVILGLASNLETCRRAHKWKQNVMKMACVGIWGHHINRRQILSNNDCQNVGSQSISGTCVINVEALGDDDWSW